MRIREDNFVVVQTTFFTLKLKRMKQQQRNLFALALAIFLLPVRGWSQVESVQGSVTDASNGEPIPGAFVIVRGTDNGASTDQNGHYVLSLKGDNNTVLVFSCIGYKEQTVSIGKRNVVDVSLSPDSEYLNEVVVIGYGTLDKKELTSAVAHVSSKEFLATSGSDPTMMIQGKVAGVSIENTAAADPNNQASIQIRGISSRTAGLGPLIVIDGIAGGNLTNVNPNDIESIDILKDGAASAIYGTRGSNGVVLINTKKGSRDGSFHTTYDMVAAANVMVNDLQMLSADEFREKKVATGMAEDLGGNDDWLKAVSRVGLSHQHTVTLSGGNMDNNFRVSADYRKATGIDKRSEREEYGARASFNHNSKNGLFTFVLNMAPRLVKSKSADWHVFHYAIEANPTTPIYNPEDPSKYFDFTGQRADKNPMEIINTELNDHEYKLLDMDATVRMNILPGLTSQLTYSDQYIGGVGGYFIPSTNNKTHRSEASRSYDQTEKHAIEWVNNFQKSFGSHNLKAMAGYSWQTLMYSGFSASNKDFANDGMTYDAIGKGEWGLEDGHDGTSSYRSDSKLIAFFGRVNYDYQGKYLFTASLRYEGSSKFGANHKWGYFPAVSAGWRISQEEFMKGCSGWLNDLKLRADFGVTGNQDVDSYMSLSTMTGYGQYYYQGNWLTVWGPSKNVNPDLRWEKGINWNVGLDFALLNNRISGSVNYFNRTQKDLLGYYNVSIPPYLFSSTFANVGTMKNSGIEFELQSTIVDTKDLSYSISLVGSTMDNRFVSFSNSEYEGQKFYYVAGTEDPFPFHYLQRIEEGERVGNFYMWKYAGFNSSGEWVVYDKNGDYKLGMDATDEDMYYVGNGLPKFTASWSNYFRYKNFDLNIFFRGAFGFDIFNIHEFYYGLPKLTSNVMKIAFTKNAQITENPLVCDYFLEKGDYLKLDLVSLGYTFKFNNKYVDSLRLSVTGKNLLTFTSFTGVDPSTYSTNGLTPGATGSRNYYPTTRQFLFGLQLGF